MEGAVESLRSAVGAEDKEKSLDTILHTLLDPANEDVTDDLANECVEKSLLDELLAIGQDETHASKVAQVLAEIAKTESVREPCVEKGFVPIFLRVLTSGDNINSMVQACRALGNMCFDNDMGRSAVDDNNGIEILLTLLRSMLSNEEPDADKLRTISCGFLLNLTNCNEVMQQKALDGGALDILETYLTKYQKEEGLCNMILNTIASLTDSEHCKERLLSSNLCSTLVEFLRSPRGDENYESILDILIALAEWDEVKDALAETSLCSHLIHMAQTNVQENAEYSEENQQKVKMASDLLILLLNGEKSMELLFDGGKGEIFSESLKWLDSHMEHLQLSGALAVGNFARSDEHCRFLVEQGVLPRLLKLLKPVYGETRCTLEHAALSALRNLAIPASNKASLIEAGVIDAVLVLVDSEMLAVLFKMLGVLRMLVDGQEEAALRLGNDREFVTRLVEWSACEEHPGVKGESTRLMAWLVKNSQTEDVMRNIIRADGIPHIVSMATSEHVVMQNESLVALTLMASTVLADAALPMKEAELTETLTGILRDDHTLPEILCNTLTLVKTILTSATPQPSQSLPCRLLACTGLLPYVGKSLREDFVASSMSEAVKSLADHSEEKVKDAVQAVMPLLEETVNVER